jgi:hypothetical protein
MRYLTIIVLSIIIAIFQQNVTFAYSVNGRDVNSSHRYNWHGVYSAIHVQTQGSNDTIQSNDQKVVSIYCYRDIDNWVEVGWFAANIPNGIHDKKARPFLARTYNGNYADKNFSDGLITPGNNYGFKLRSVLGTHNWAFYLNDVWQYTTSNASFAYGQAIGSAERFTYGSTSNWAHYWHLQAMDSQASWLQWNVAQWTTPPYPDLYYHYRKVNNWEYYSEEN